MVSLIVLAIAVRFFFWAYTGRTWEDALITVQHSENAAAGLGLTHTPSNGPPLHGFTSPISVLVPLLGDLIHVGFGLSLIKLIPAFVAGIAVFLGFQVCRDLDLPPVLALIVAAYLAFEHHQILWGMSGMETQGFTLGLCMLARPDAAIWVAIACAYEIFLASRAKSFSRLRPLLIAIAALYGPWIVFTTVYYGNPIPNTIRAKGLGYASFWGSFRAESTAAHLPLIDKLYFIFRHCLEAFSALGPVYEGNGTGFQPLWNHNRIIFSLMALLCVPGPRLPLVPEEDTVS